MRDSKHKTKTEVQIGYEENHFHHKDSSAVERVAQRGYTVSVLGGFQDPTV